MRRALLSAIFDEMRNMIINDNSRANITTVTKTPTGDIIIRLSMAVVNLCTKLRKYFGIPNILLKNGKSCSLKSAIYRSNRQ